MHNALFVDELNAVNNLEHILNDLTFRQLKIFINDSLKQLTTRDPVNDRDETDGISQRTLITHLKVEETAQDLIRINAFLSALSIKQARLISAYSMVNKSHSHSEI